MPPLRISGDLPKDVERYVDEGTEQGLPEGKAWAVAWSRFCKYKKPGDSHCEKPADGYFTGRKAADMKEIEIAFRVPGAGGWKRKSFRTETEATNWVDEFRKTNGDDVEVRFKEASLAALSRRVVVRHLASIGDGAVLANVVRQRINTSLIRAGMDGNRRFRSTGAALNSVAEVLQDFLIEWDQVISASDVSGDSGRLSIALASKTGDPFSPGSIRNTALSFHWTTLGTGVEAVAYLG